MARTRGPAFVRALLRQSLKYQIKGPLRRGDPGGGGLRILGFRRIPVEDIGEVDPPIGERHPAREAHGVETWDIDATAFAVATCPHWNRGRNRVSVGENAAVFLERRRVREELAFERLGVEFDQSVADDASVWVSFSGGLTNGVLF